MFLAGCLWHDSLTVGTLWEARLSPLHGKRADFPLFLINKVFYTKIGNTVQSYVRLAGQHVTS